MQITLNGLSFGYSSVPVLKDINLDINGPQIVSIIGPNGVGKSTLIQCINKILTPTGGSVMIDDEDVSEISIKKLAAVMGYVPCTAGTAFSYSVVDTVLMGRHPHSNWKTTDRDLNIVYETLRKLDIEKLALKPFNELSAGQHQKVMIARGLVQEPKYLLLDEPTSNLDIRHQMDVTRLLMEIAHERDIIVIMISHDLNIAATYSDKIIMMHEGRIFAAGEPDDVITEENLFKVYGVRSSIIKMDGRNHIILLDEKLKDTRPVDNGSTVSIS